MTMSVGARELALFVDNDSALYRQRTVPIIKNLTVKKARGTYRHDLAVKAFMYLADAGAKRYAAEHGAERGKDWHVMFPVADRKQAAAEWARGFETEYGLGNYDQYIPQRYAKERSARPSSSRGMTTKRTADSRTVERASGTSARRTVRRRAR